MVRFIFFFILLINIEDIRGNIDTRIKKLEDKKFDAIILAAAGVKRLNLENKISLQPCLIFIDISFLLWADPIISKFKFFKNKDLKLLLNADKYSPSAFNKTESFKLLAT